MTGSSHTNLIALFEDFLAYLRHQGFIIGVGHYLRLQELLGKVGGQCDPAELKTLLCPIFATSKNQQEKFHKAFDTHFALFQIAPEQQPLEDNEQEYETIKPPDHSETNGVKNGKKKILFLIALILAVSISAIIFLKPQPHSPNANQNSNRQIDNNDLTNSTNSNTSKKSDNLNSNTSPVKQDSAGPEISSGPGPNKSQPPPLNALIDREVIRWGIVTAPFIIFLIFEWFNYRRRKLVLQKQRGEKPDFVYTLRIEGPDSKIFNSEQLYTAARRMRRRQIDNVYTLDVAATVAATSRSMGYPTLQYKSGSRIPEYLMLIDRSSFRDHQAQLFESLAQALRKEGIYIVSYYYDGDPRICCDQNNNCFHIVQLQNKHSDHHLLIFGDGDSLVDPLTGELETWSSYFLNWRSRAILTPEAPGRWGLREEALAHHFVVTTADLKGLLAIIDLFEKDVATGPRLLRESGDEPASQELDRANLIQPLRQYLGEEVFQWVCACAVYPELQWGLSLFLGSLPCMEKDLIKEENLLRLAKLSWFRKGVIPDETRLLLISHLDKSKEKAIRAAIIELLEQAPRAGSLQNEVENFSANTYALNLAVEKWLYRKDKAHLFRLRKVIIKLPKEQVYRDYTLIRFLESPLTSRLALLLPKKLRAVFYPNAISKLNPRISLRLGLMIGLTLLVWAGLNKAMPPLSKAKIMDFSASQTTVEAGDTANLYFEVSDAASLRIDPDIGDLRPVDKDVVPVTLDQTTTYKLTASDSAGRAVTRELTIEVTGKDRARIVNFSADPATVIPGAETRLCYELRNADEYRISSDTYGVLAQIKGSFLASECKPVIPLATTVYTIEVTGKDGYTVSQTVTVQVVSTDAVRIDSFKADSSAINLNDSTRLCFQVSNASKTEIIANTGETVNLAGNCATVKPASTTVYTLIVTGQNGQQQRQSLTVNVATTQALIKEFSTNPPVITGGSVIQVCWQVISSSNFRIILADDQRVLDTFSGFGNRSSCTTTIANKSTVYTLTVVSSNGVNTKKQTSVELVDLFRITGITISPDPVIAGEEASVCVKTSDSQHIRSVTVTPDLKRMATRGFDPCFKLIAQETTTYSVVIQSRDGQIISDQFTVQVQPANKAPVITSLTANPPAIAQGEKVDVCYQVENADGVTYSEQLRRAGLPAPLNLNRGYELIPVMARQNTTTGDLEGLVSDPSNQRIAGATVVITNLENGSTYKSLTDETGNFRFSAILPGRYKIVASKEGYEDRVISSFIIHLGQRNIVRPPDILLRPKTAPATGDTSQSNAGPRLPMFVKGNQNCLSFQPTRTTTYTVTAKNSAGTDAKSITVPVK